MNFTENLAATVIASILAVLVFAGGISAINGAKTFSNDMAHTVSKNLDAESLLASQGVKVR